MEYTLIDRSDTEDFIADVNAHLKEGWRPLGTASIHENFNAMSMVRETAVKEETDNTRARGWRDGVNNAEAVVDALLIGEGMDDTAAAKNIHLALQALSRQA